MPSCLPGERLGRDRCSLEGGARTHDALQRGLVAHQERDLREQPQGWREAEMTPAQCRAARALITLPRPELAKAAVVPLVLIADYEAGMPGLRPEDLVAIQAVLENAGIEFINDIGVKLRRKA